MAHVAGLVAAGLHPSPVGFAPVITSTTHKTLRGPRSAFILTNAAMATRVDRAVFPGTSGGPHQHTIAAKAVAFNEALSAEFRDYSAAVIANAQALAEGLQAAGLRLVSGGTENHLLLVDVGVRGLTGRAVEAALEASGITVNKNTIPFDTRKPMVTSGIRIGTPALTTRGLRGDEMRTIARLIGTVLDGIDDGRTHAAVRAEVAELVREFPVPGIE